MATLAEFRRQYPQYDDMSDDALAERLYTRHYSDLPRAQFYRQIGLGGSYTQEPSTTEWTRGRELEQASERLNTPDWMRGLARRGDAAYEALAQGLSFGFNDELEGAGAAARRAVGGPNIESTIRGDNPGDAYQSATDAARERLASARTLYPGQSAGAEIAGAALTSAAVPGKAFATLPRAVGSSAALGALYGEGTGEGNALERLPSAAVGAGVGGALGAGGYALGKGIGAIIEGVRRAGRPADAKALEMMVVRLQRDNVAPADIQKVLNQWRANGGNIEEAIIDVLPDQMQNLRGLGRAVANVPGPGKGIARQRLVERSRGANYESVADDRLQGSGRRIAERGYQTLTGKKTVPGGGDHQAMVRSVNEQARATAAPLYEQATATPFPDDAFEVAFMPLFRDEAVGPIWRRTALRALARVRGQAGGQQQRALAALARGEAPAAQDLTVGTLHRLRMAISDEIGAATRAGENDLASSLISFRDDFMDPWIATQGNAGQAYHVARQTVRAGHEVTRALEDGQKIFTMPESEFWARVADLSDPERQAFAMGALREIARKAGRTENARDAISLILSREMRERLRAVWPRDARGADTPVRSLLRRLRRERTMQETFNEMLTGSRTTPLAEDIADATFRQGPISDVLNAIEEVLGGASAGKPFRDALARGFNRLRQPGIHNEAINKAVATRLFSRVDDGLVRDLEAAGRARAASRARVQRSPAARRTAQAASVLQRRGE